MSWEERFYFAGLIAIVGSLALYIVACVVCGALALLDRPFDPGWIAMPMVGIALGILLVVIGTWFRMVRRP